MADLPESDGAAAQQQGGETLEDTLDVLGGFSAAVPEEVAAFFLSKSGFESPDPRVYAIFLQPVLRGCGWIPEVSLLSLWLSFVLSPSLPKLGEQRLGFWSPPERESVLLVDSIRGCAGSRSPVHLSGTASSLPSIVLACFR